MKASFRLYFVLTLAVIALVWFVVVDQQPTIPSEDSQPEYQSLPIAELAVTQGAAAGYVEDQQCATCHADIYESYQHVGMSKSFANPTPDKLIEQFPETPYYHQPSKRYYRMDKSENGLMFVRYQLDDAGQPINTFKQPVDFILGSGNKTRSYLFRNPAGEMYQLPVGWYTATQQWAMSPGYDNAHHEGVTRPIQRECLFCHNAFPEVEANSDLHWQPHTFPAELPQGTGCQRCHGPGGEHIRTVMAGAESIEAIHASIVNPAKLPIAERDSVCFQCHMLPSVSLVGARRFDRADYSFRPSEDINDYLLHVDVDELGFSKDERFEINHHAYRLRRSSCFTQSEGALTCISCHNPHSKVPQEQRAEHYGKVCQSCHEGGHQPQLEDTTDCVSCHMPQRRNPGCGACHHDRSQDPATC